MLYKYRFLFYGFFILILGLSFAVLYISFTGNDDPLDDDPGTKELNGVFSVNEGKVYAVVPSNGHYEVKGANAATFKTVPDRYSDSHIGYDDRYVYAGNIILEGLDPDKLKVLGNNYYTDGSTTYYCDGNSENNESLGAVGYIIRLAGQSLGIADKPQTYWYPFVKLPEAKTYQSVPGADLAVDGRKAFYKGLEMNHADPKGIRPLKIHYPDRDVRDSDSYFTDGKNVYYRDQLLPLAYNDAIHEITVEGDVPSGSAYLLDPEKGMVYVNGKPFDESKAPYRLLGMNLSHACQVLFIAGDGLYFYNSESDKVERAGDNPFADKPFEEIAPDVFSGGNKIYYLEASENWGKKTGLQSRSTHLLELENVQPAGLRKISGGDLTYGSVWQSANRFFYFDDLGSSQLMPSAIYEIKDLATVRYLIDSKELRPDDIRQLESSGKLAAAEGKNAATATTPFGNDWYDSYWIVFAGIGLALLITFLTRHMRIDPFLIKDGDLIINNLMFTRYRISQIDRIIFRVERALKGGGYNGRMQIFQTNGKTSRNIVFSTRATLMPESEATVKTYINALRNQLEKEGIRSELGA